MFLTQGNPERGRLSGNKKEFGLVAGLNFNTASIKPAIAFDSSGNHYHGLVSGATHLPTGGFNSLGAYDFDGVDDYIELNDAPVIKEGVDLTAVEGNPSGVCWKPDKTSLMLVGFANDTIRQYNCSTAGDVSTATLFGSFAVSGQDTFPGDIVVSPDGLTLLMLGGLNDTVYQYTMSTSWDITTMSYASSSFSVSVGGTETDPQGITASADFTKFWIVGTTLDSIREYNLVLPIAGSSYTGNSLSPGIEATPAYIKFKSDGTKFYFGGPTTDIIYEYQTVTPNTIVGATRTNVDLYIGGLDTTIRGIDISDDGKTLIMAGDGNNKVYQYTLPSTWSFSLYPNGITLSAWIAPDSAGEGTVGRIFDNAFPSNGSTGLRYWTGANLCTVSINAGTQRSSAAASVPFGSYTFVAVTVDSTGLATHYINGSASGTPGTTGKPQEITSITKTIIGNRGNATDSTFDGKIDNPRIYNRVLSADEISALYTSQKEAKDFVGIPKLTTTMRDAIVAPPNPYQIYNLTTGTIQTWNGAAWV